MDNKKEMDRNGSLSRDTLTFKTRLQIKCRQQTSVLFQQSNARSQFAKFTKSELPKCGSFTIYPAELKLSDCLLFPIIQCRLNSLHLIVLDVEEPPTDGLQDPAFYILDGVNGSYFKYMWWDNSLLIFKYSEIKNPHPLSENLCIILLNNYSPYSLNARHNLPKMRVRIRMR